MTPRASARYRLALADRSIESARGNLSRSGWRDAALFARAAVEHAAKAILACFEAVPRSHEPAQLLAAALASPRFPARLRARAEALCGPLAGYGVREHILLSYGDEEHQVDPWAIVTEARARGHLEIAEQALALARDCVAEIAA